MEFGKFLCGQTLGRVEGGKGGATMKGREWCREREKDGETEARVCVWGLGLAVLLGRPCESQPTAFLFSSTPPTPPAPFFPSTPFLMRSTISSIQKG